MKKQVVWTHTSRKHNLQHPCAPKSVDKIWPKMAIFCQQLSFLAKKYQLRAQISVFWVWVVSWCPRYPILRVLDSKEDVLHAIEAISQLFPATSPENGEKSQFSARNKAAPRNGHFFCPKLANFRPKTVFCGLGWPVQGPLTLFRRCWTQKKHVLQHMAAGKWVSQGRPPPQNGHFLPQRKGLKMPIFGHKQFLLGLGGHFKALHPLSQVLDSKQHVLQGMGAGKWVIHPPPQKNGHFLPKKGVKLPIFGLGGHFKSPPTYFAGA